MKRLIAWWRRREAESRRAYWIEQTRTLGKLGLLVAFSATALAGPISPDTWSFTGFAPVTWTKGVSGTPNNFGEQNELVLSSSNYGANVLSIRNTSSFNPLSTITFRTGNDHEKGAIGYFGIPSNSPWQDSVFIEISDIDNPSLATANSPSFYILQTSSFGGQEGFGQYSRFQIKPDGSLAINDRTGGAMLGLSATGRTMTFSAAQINSTSPLTMTTNRDSVGNTYNLVSNETWNPSADANGTHTGGYFAMVSAGSHNIAGGMESVSGTVILSGSGNVASANALTGWVRNLGTGTLTDGSALFIRSPDAGATAPITNVAGIIILPQKVAGVTNGSAFVSLGVDDASEIAGTLFVGRGVILASPDGTKWKLQVSNAGELSAVSP